MRSFESRFRATSPASVIRAPRPATEQALVSHPVLTEVDPSDPLAGVPIEQREFAVADGDGFEVDVRRLDPRLEEALVVPLDLAPESPNCVVGTGLGAVVLAEFQMLPCDEPEIPSQTQGDQPRREPEPIPASGSPARQFTGGRLSHRRSSREDARAPSDFRSDVFRNTRLLMSRTGGGPTRCVSSVARLIMSPINTSVIHARAVGRRRDRT
jgi:hypothetical protein